MPTPRKYDNETRARAVRMCQDRISEGTLSKAAVYREVGGLLDINPETLRSWADQDLATHQAQTPGEVSKEEIARLRRENAQLRRANEILKTASVDSTGQRNTIENVLGGVMWQRSVDQGSRLIDGSKCGKCGRQAHQSARLVELWALRQAPSSQSCCPMVGSISRSRGVALAH